MKDLKGIIEIYKEKYQLYDEFELIKSSTSISPFSYEIDCLSYLLSNNFISFDEYQDIKRQYFQMNKYLSLYDQSPRTFGEVWGEKHIITIFPEFKKATVENRPDFNGEYDLVIEGIRVEVKACRANNPQGGGSLSTRAYSHLEAKENRFKYHFQQLKPSCCDVFIWIGVCKDELIYWVLTSDELKRTGKLGSQHRNENTGTGVVEVFEGQVFMTEEELSPFLVLESEVLEKVIEKGKR